MHHHGHVRPIVVRRRFAQDFTAGEQFMENLLKPKLGGLMDDDEQHFIMCQQLPFLQAEDSARRAVSFISR